MSSGIGKYPCATTGSLKGDQAHLAAINWVLAKHRELGGGITLHVASMSALRNPSNRRLLELSKRPGVRTTKDTVLSGGVILAAWPSRDALTNIVDAYDLRALCVIPWVERDVDGWEQVVDPERLDHLKPPCRKPTTLDPVVIEGLKTATIMTKGELNSSLDRRDADDVLKRLRRAGVDLPPDEIFAWALKNGWPARHAAELSKMAAHVNTLKRITRRKDSALRHDIFEQWRLKADAKTVANLGDPTPLDAEEE